jgi:hypothetical protein
MKIKKQEKVLAIFATGRYKCEGDEILTLKVNGWRPLQPNKLPSGYQQVHLFSGERYGRGISVLVYKHIAIYLFNNGLYPEGFQIDHLDRDNTNNLPSNLMAKSCKGNRENQRARPMTIKGTRIIRHKEIAAIRVKHAAGTSQARIAAELDLNRLSVRYIIKKIEAGLPLKYERPQV